SLPGVLLPPDWPGQKARLLCSELYRRLLAPSARHLDACFQLADGVVPEASARLHERFRDTDLLALPAWADSSRRARTITVRGSWSQAAAPRRASRCAYGRAGPQSAARLRAAWGGSAGSAPGKWRCAGCS